MTQPTTIRQNEPAARQSGRNGRPAGSAPVSPTGLRADSWLAAAKRSISEFKNDNLQDRAAALTYYGIQAIWPGNLSRMETPATDDHAQSPALAGRC